jgi:hypothetical protein
MDCKITKYTLDTASEAYKRMELAGFTIIRFEHVGDMGRALFKCVCGKLECIAFKIDKDEIDVAAILENSGAVSVEHLQKDGYNPAQIEEIRKGYVCQ